MFCGVETVAKRFSDVALILAAFFIVLAPSIGESCRAIEFEKPTVTEKLNQKFISWVFLGQ